MIVCETFISTSIALCICSQASNGNEFNRNNFWNIFFYNNSGTNFGFPKIFYKTILGTNGAIRISDRFQDFDNIVNKLSKDGNIQFRFKNREGAVYKEGIDYPDKIRNFLSNYPSIIGISEVFEDFAIMETKSRRQNVHIHGIEIRDHLLVSDLRNQITKGSISTFSSDQMGIFIGTRIAERLNLQIEDRVNIVGKNRSFQLRVSGIFETGASDIDKKRVYIFTNCKVPSR